MGIEKIEGRSDDVLYFESNDGKQIKIFPDFFRRAIIMSNDQISDYSLVQSGKNELQLFVNNNADIYEQAIVSIVELLNLRGIHGVKLIRSEVRHHEKGNKLRRIRNDYRKTN